MPIPRSFGAPLKILVDYSAEGLFASERDRREVLKAAFLDAGHFWHQKYLPRHFKRGADTRYGYRPRTAGYAGSANRVGSKVRAAIKGIAVEGGLTPLVFRGLLRRTLTQGAVIKSFPSRFSVYMLAPDYAPQRQRTPKQPPLIEEAFRMLPKEQEELANFTADRITHHNQRVRRRRRVRLG